MGPHDLNPGFSGRIGEQDYPEHVSTLLRGSGDSESFCKVIMK